jgi:hypothetical protein
VFSLQYVLSSFWEIEGPQRLVKFSFLVPRSAHRNECLLQFSFFVLQYKAMICKSFVRRLRHTSRCYFESKANAFSLYTEIVPSASLNFS